MSPEKEVMNATIELIASMSQGNPGALTALATLSQNFNAVICFRRLKQLNLSGEEIYMLWNDSCHRDTKLFARLLDDRFGERVTNGYIKSLIADKGRGKDVNLDYAQVCDNPSKLVAHLNEKYVDCKPGHKINFIVQPPSPFDPTGQYPEPMILCTMAQMSTHLALDRLIPFRHINAPGVDGLAYIEWLLNGMDHELRDFKNRGE